MRKGYEAEYWTRKELEKQYPTIIKIAIGQHPVRGDFLCINKNRIEKIVEVKQTHQTKYYSTSREIKQLNDIKNFCLKNNIKFEVWIWKITNRKKHLEIRKIV